MEELTTVIYVPLCLSHEAARCHGLNSQDIQLYCFIMQGKKQTSNELTEQGHRIEKNA